MSVNLDGALSEHISAGMFTSGSSAATASSSLVKGFPA
jgi:hypothetical protein